MELTRIIYGIFCLLFIVYLGIRKRSDIWKAIKGEDSKLQVTEIVASIWIFMFLVLVFGEIVTNTHASDKLWDFMTLVYLITIAGHSAQEIFQKRKPLK